MHRQSKLVVASLLALLLLGPTGCTSSSWCADCAQATAILGLNYQPNNTYTVAMPIPVNPPNPSGGTPRFYELASGALPPGLSLDPGTGRITGTPTAAGVYTLTIRATNAANSASQTLQIVVVPALPLALGYGTPMVFPAASAIAVQTPALTQSTPGLPTAYAVTAGSLPAGLTLNPDGTISGTPTTPGVSSFTVTATNGTRTATASATYTITPSGSLGLNYATPQTFGAGLPIAAQVPAVVNPTPGVVTTFAVTSGTLPAGLSLDPATGGITGTPTTPGVSTFTVTATNGSRTAISTPTYVVTPAPPLALAYASPQTFAAGTAITAQPAILTDATPGVATTYVVTGGILPAGLGLDATTGAITGTPTTPGVFPFTVTATNGTRTAAAAATYTVVPVGALTLGYTTPQTFPAGTAIATQVPAVSNETPGLTTTFAVTTGSLPAGLTLNTDGTLTGTPTTPGIYAFTVTAANGARTATSDVSYTVTPAAALTLDYATPQTFTAGTAITTQTPLVANDTPGLTTTYAVTGGSLPDGLTLNADGTLTGTPTTPGVYSFTVTATNGTRTAARAISYTVTPAAALTLDYLTPQTFTAGVAITTQTPAVANATPGLTTTYAVTGGSLPDGLTLNADGTVTGTPTTPGVYSFTVTATNGGRAATATPSYTVVPAAALVLGYATPQTFTAGATITTQLPALANATPGLTTTYAVTGGSLPDGLTLNADGTVTGAPTTPGVYSFTVTATNGGRTATAMTSYTVTPAAAMTLGYSTPQTFVSGTAIVPQLPAVANATPGLATTYAVTGGSLPAGLVLNADGTVTGTPTTPGVYSFTVTATNGSRTATANPTYTVNALAPTGLAYASPVTYTSGFGISPNSPNPTGGAPTNYAVTSGGLPAGLNLDPATGIISGTPTTPGTYSVTITGSNATGGTNQALSMTVLAPLTASLSANPALVAVGQATSLTALFSGGTGTLDQGFGPVTSGGGLSTAVYTTSGTFTYTLTVTNTAGASLTRTATVTVVAAPPNSISITVPMGGVTSQVSAPGTPLDGLAVLVPSQGAAVCADTVLTVTREIGQPLPGSLASGVIAVSDPWTLSSTVGYPFRVPMTVTLPYDGSALAAADVAVPFYWDPAYGKWVSVGLKSIDATNSRVTFTTLLPGQYAVLAIPGLGASLTTQTLGFASGTDGWFQPNQGIYDVPGGAGLGMSAYAAWYFGFKKSDNGNAGLYTQMLQGSLTSASDDVNARALISRLGNGTLESWNTLWTQGAYQLTNLQTGLAIVTGLRVTTQPQIFLMGEARPAVGNAMATLITGYDKAAGKFSVLDPNYPGMPLTITWNSSTGAFTAYDRAAGYVPTFTQYAMEGQTSIHRLSDFERVFNGANDSWGNPPFAAIAVADVAGAGAPVSGLVTVPSSTNVNITGTVANGDVAASHIFWSQNGGAKTPVPLAAGAFSFTIPALADPYGTRIALETTGNPCDPTFSFTGYSEFTVKEVGRTPWFPNICFESGTTAPWTLEQGSNSSKNYPATPTWSAATGEITNYAISWSTGSLDSALVNVANDPNVPSIPQVYDGSWAFRVNNPATGAHISRVQQVITIPADVNIPKLSFFWAAVMEDPGHTAAQQPFVDIIVEDVTNANERVYYKHFYANDPSYPGWIAGSSDWLGINWQQVALTDLTARKGHQLRIRVVAADCTLGGHGGYAYLDGVSCN
jgi:hypothetical protein